MPTPARMRHHNSPEELAKRSGEAARTPKGAGFRHYNHPEEVARRASLGQQGGASVVPSSRPPQPRQQVVEAWPPPGTPNNAPAPDPIIAAARELPEPPPKGIEGRLARVETLVFTFLESVREAREFRRLLNNQQALTDAQLDIAARMQALEQSFDHIAAELDAQLKSDVDDGGDVDDEEPESPAEPASEAPAEPLAAPEAGAETPTAEERKTNPSLKGKLP